MTGRVVALRRLAFAAITASTCRPGAADPTPPAPRCADGASPAGCWVWVEGGEALLGASADPQSAGHDPAARPEEGPPVRRSVNGFWLQNTEVTVGAWRACLASGACRPDDVTAPPPSGDLLPITGLRHAGAERYCASIGARLPTEDEWEWAARGAPRRRFSFGEMPRCVPLSAATEARVQGEIDTTLQLCAQVVADLDAGRPAAVAADHLAATRCRELRSFHPAEVVDAVRSARGLAPIAAGPCAHPGPSEVQSCDTRDPRGMHCLSGNVAEWTASPWTATRGAPPAEGEARRVLKGGSWMATDAVDLRAAARLGEAPDLGLPDVGVRCARDGAAP